MVQPSQCSSFLPPLNKAIAVFTVTAVTCLVSGLLTVYYPYFAAAAKVIGTLSVGAATTYFLAHCVSQCRKNRELQKPVQSSSGPSFLISFYFFLPYAGQRQYLFFSPTAMKALFPNEQTEKRVFIGKNVYTAVEKRELYNETMGLNSYQEEIFKPFIGDDVSQNPINVTAVDNSSVIPAKKVQINISLPNDKASGVVVGKKDLFEGELKKLLIDEVFANKQTMIHRINGIEPLEILVLNKDDSKGFFRITSETLIDFQLHNLTYA